jgi:hypothetical protein
MTPGCCISGKSVLKFKPKVFLLKTLPLFDGEGEYERETAGPTTIPPLRDGKPLYRLTILRSNTLWSVQQPLEPQRLLDAERALELANKAYSLYEMQKLQ